MSARASTASCPASVDHRHPLHHLRPVAAVAAGVHVDAAARRARHADEDVQAGKPRGGRTPRGERRGQPGTNGPALAVRPQLVEPLPQPDDERVETLVRQQDVGAQPDGEPRHAGRVGRPQRDRDVFGAGRQHHRGGAPDPIGRVPRQRLVFPHLAPERRPELPDERGVARGQPVHSGDISRASACHSWSGRTSPARLLSAMTASLAADAPESVVVYGTRCWSAACRMA